jgi:hypothetical protein
MRSLKFMLVAAASLLALTACGLGNPIPHTVSMGGVGNGIDINVSDVLVQDAQLVAGEAGTGMALTIINKAELTDALRSVTINDIPAIFVNAGVTAPNGFKLNAGTSLQIGFNSTYAIVVPEALEAGAYAQVTLDFANAGITEFDVLINDNVGEYAKVVTEIVG